MHLVKWKARRAGARITVVGTDPVSGHAAKIVGVDYIEPDDKLPQCCVAVDKTGTKHMLHNVTA